MNVHRVTVLGAQVILGDPAWLASFCCIFGVAESVVVEILYRTIDSGVPQVLWTDNRDET
jgi:hypothetical protein